MLSIIRTKIKSKGENILQNMIYMEQKWELGEKQRPNYRVVSCTEIPTRRLGSSLPLPPEGRAFDACH